LQYLLKKGFIQFSGGFYRGMPYLVLFPIKKKYIVSCFSKLGQNEEILSNYYEEIICICYHCDGSYFYQLLLQFAWLKNGLKILPG